MTLEDLGNIGDFAGGLGVVITFIYLAVQIRQNTRSTNANTRIVMAERSIETIRSVRTDDALLAAMIKSRAEKELSAEEDLRLQLYFRESMRVAEQTFCMRRIGLVDEKEFMGTRNFYLTLFTNPRVRSFIKQHREEFSPDFMVEVDELLRNSSA